MRAHFRALWIVLALIAIIVVGYLFASQSRVPETERPAVSDTTSGLRVGKNAIYIPDQEPGAAVSVGFVIFEKDGFVVIHETNQETMEFGNVIGSSRYFSAGEYNDVTVELTRETVDGEFLIGMIHADDGDGTYEEDEDAPMLENDEPVWMIFPVSSEAAGSGETEVIL